MDILAVVGVSVVHASWATAVLFVGLHAATRGTNAPAVRYRVGVTALVLSASTLAVAGGALLLFASSPSAASFLPGSGGRADAAGALWRIGPTGARVAGALWASGAVFLLLRFVVDRWVVARWVARAQAARPEWQAEVRRAEEEAGIGTVRAYESGAIDSPLVVGTRRPVLVLPSAVFASLSADHRRALLLHEMAHLTFGHPRTRALEIAAEHLLYFHPLLPAFRRFLERERERSCDLHASARCGGPVAFARALAGLELARAGGHGWKLGGLGAGGAAVLPRIRWLASDDVARCMSAAGSIRAARIMAVAGTAMLLAMCAVAPRSAPLSIRAAADTHTIHASDPAGDFTLTMRDGIALRATVDGRALPTRAILQQGNSVRLVNGTRTLLSLRLTEAGGIRWQPRVRTPAGQQRPASPKTD